MLEQGKPKNPTNQTISRRDSNNRKEGGGNGKPHGQKGRGNFNGPQRERADGDYVAPTRQHATIFNFITQALPEAAAKEAENGPEPTPKHSGEQEHVNYDANGNIHCQSEANHLDGSANADHSGNDTGANGQKPFTPYQEGANNDRQFNGRNNPRRRNGNFNNNNRFQYAPTPYFNNNNFYYPPVPPPMAYSPPSLYICPPPGIAIGRTVIAPNLCGNFYRGRVVDINPFEGVALVEYTPDGNICNVSFDLIQPYDG